MEYPNEVAQLNKPAISTTGNFKLELTEIEEDKMRYNSFRVLNNRDSIIFQPPEKFDSRHTIFILWDTEERIWVYSGDEGTYYWELIHSNNWVKKVFSYNNTNEVAAPNFLKKVRPQFHK